MWVMMMPASCRPDTADAHACSELLLLLLLLFGMRMRCGDTRCHQ
jgi:hypothetical protein